MKPRCVILGGGGHAKVVIETLLQQGAFQPAGVTDPRPVAGAVLSVPVLGDDRVLKGLRRRGITHFIVGMGGVPDTHRRAELFARGLEAGLKPVIAIHPSASVASSARIEPGTVIFPHATVNPEARIGRNAIVNTGAIVEHDAHIEDHVHLCPGSAVSGGVRVGEGTFVGAGAVLREGIRLGPWAIIGAGAVVLKDVPARALAVGVPARIARKRSP